MINLKYLMVITFLVLSSACLELHVDNTSKGEPYSDENDEETLQQQERVEQGVDTQLEEDQEAVETEIEEIEQDGVNSSTPTEGTDPLTEMLNELLEGFLGGGQSGDSDDLLGALLGDLLGGDLGGLSGLLGEGEDGSYCLSDDNCADGYGCDLLQIPLGDLPTGIDLPVGQCRAVCDPVFCGIGSFLGLVECCENAEYTCEINANIENLEQSTAYCRSPTESGIRF